MKDSRVMSALGALLGAQIDPGRHNGHKEEAKAASSTSKSSEEPMETSDGDKSKVYNFI